MSRSWISTRRAFLVAIALLCVSCASRSADAQIPLIPKIRLKAGVFVPTNSSLKDLIGGTWFKVGADITLPLGIPLLSGGTRLGVDYVANGSSNIIPITLTSIIQPSVGVSSPVYVGGGFGLWTGHIKGKGTSSQLGLRILGGFDLGKSTFIEAQYDIVGKLGGVRADGFSVLMGLKF